MLQVGQIISAKYEILKELGRGGMSVVYQARDLSTGMLLAIKDVKRSGKENDQMVVQSLATEGRMLKGLSNPHLPKIYDIVEDEDSFMVVMDYIDGVSLDKVIVKVGPQREDRIYQWAMQVCEVFDYLHNQTPPIVYRDMKPANIMVKRDGNIMMIDFGTARTQKVGMAMTADTVCIGTEGFAAPEQFGGFGQSDARTDIFCLGGTIYNLITGHSPCDKPKGILPLEYWNPELAKSPLNYIISKCTKNDPNERYQTALELMEDLRLASIGALKASGQTKGATGFLKRSGWQRQSLKDGNGNGSTGALSGLLGRGRGKSSKLSNNTSNPVPQAGASDPAPQPQKSAAGWTTNTGMQPQVQPMDTQTTQPVEQMPVQTDLIPEELPGNDLWRKLMIYAGAGTVGLLLLGIILLLAGVKLAGYLLLILAVGGLVLTIVGLIETLKEQNQE